CILTRALIVETMAHFVADDRADAAIDDGRIGGRIEERGLQDRGRKDNLVPSWIVICIDRERGDAPFVAVCWTIDALDLPIPFVGRGALRVAERIVGPHIVR